jgi:DNA-binding beta-propeller fold protein YncE
VTDHFNDRVEHFGSDGRYQAQLGTLAGPSVSATGTPTTLSVLVSSAPIATATLTPSVTATTTATISPATLTPAPTVSATASAPIANAADAQLRRPEGIAVDRDGNLWVADYGRDRVVKLSPDGHLLLVVGDRGAGPGEFIGPKGVTVDPNTGRIYVADTGNGRIQRLFPDGTPDAIWLMPGS